MTRCFNLSNTNVEYVCANPWAIDIMYFLSLMIEPTAGLSFQKICQLCLSLPQLCTFRTSIYTTLFHNVSQLKD